MAIAPHEELAIYQTDHARWVANAAPGIAEGLQTLSDELLASSWAMLKRETQVAVWARLTAEVRARIEATRGKMSAPVPSAGAVPANTTRTPVTF